MIVAECGSIAEAARRLSLTPTAVAQRLKAIEQEIGHSLVVRNGRTVRLTASGLAVLEEARALIQSTWNLSAIAATNLAAGELRLGATASASTGLLPDVIAKLDARYPQIELHVKPGQSVELYHLVLSGRLDAAIIIEPQFSTPKSLGWTTLREEPLVLITPAAMPVDEPHTMIKGSPFIRYDRAQWGGQIVDRYLRRYRLNIRQRLELDALDAIAALVDRELGVAVVPDWAPPWPAGLSVNKIHLPQSTETRNVGVIWDQSSSKIAAVRAFIGACIESSATLPAISQSRPRDILRDTTPPAF